MGSSLRYYKFGVRKDSEIRFGKGKIESLMQFPFSLPPQNNDSEDFVIINRPKVLGMEDFVERHLNESNLDTSNRENKKDNNIKRLMKKL